MFMKTENIFGLLTLGVVFAMFFSTTHSQHQEARVARSQNERSTVRYRANSWWSKRALLPTTPEYSASPLPDQRPSGTSTSDVISRIPLEFCVRLYFSSTHGSEKFTTIFLPGNTPCVCIDAPEENTF